jgi:molybdate transport system substrate-binding protein
VSRRAWTLASAALLSARLHGPAAADELTVAAAADLSFALRDLARAFEEKTGHSLRLSFGSSGNFYAQIRNGAPFDVFFSADIEYPRLLASQGRAEAGSLQRYAVGRLVLWAPRSAPFDVRRLGMDSLRDPRVRKLAIANPRHAPYGRAAEAALRHFGLYEAVSPRLVLGENVTQAAQFVESGAADLGLIALSLALSPTMKNAGSWWRVPAEAHPPLEQAAVVISSSRARAAARAFLDHLRTEEAVAVLRAYGFTRPADTAQ